MRRHAGALLLATAVLLVLLAAVIVAGDAEGPSSGEPDTESITSEPAGGVGDHRGRTVRRLGTRTSPAVPEGGDRDPSSGPTWDDGDSESADATLLEAMVAIGLKYGRVPCECPVATQLVDGAVTVENASHFNKAPMSFGVVEDGVATIVVPPGHGTFMIGQVPSSESAVTQVVVAATEGACRCTNAGTLPPTEVHGEVVGLEARPSRPDRPADYNGYVEGCGGRASVGEGGAFTLVVVQAPGCEIRSVLPAEEGEAVGFGSPLQQGHIEGSMVLKARAPVGSSVDFVRDYDFADMDAIQAQHEMQKEELLFLSKMAKDSKPPQTGQ